ARQNQPLHLRSNLFVDGCRACIRDDDIQNGSFACVVGSPEARVVSPGKRRARSRIIGVPLIPVIRRNVLHRIGQGAVTSPHPYGCNTA
ncbi:MAG: hypothetical protein RR362_05825, partial [Raoultibacter sp.]